MAHVRLMFRVVNAWLAAFRALVNGRSEYTMRAFAMRAVVLLLSLIVMLTFLLIYLLAFVRCSYS